MKKFLFSLAVISLAVISCKKTETTPDGPVSLDATMELTTELGSLVYAEPVTVSATVTSASTIDGFTFTAVKKSGDTYQTVGEDQDYAASSNEISGEFFCDSKEMTDIMVTVKAGNAEKSFYFPVEGVTGDVKGDVWMNDAAILYADNKVATHENDPENYPVEGTGAGSDTKSFFSMHGLEIDGTVEHILSLNQLRAVDGKNGSMCFLNCLQNTSNNAYIGGQRGYMFSGLRKASLGGGTTGRQCDLYEVDGHAIKDENIDYDFGMKVVNGSWKEGYDAELFAFVDKLFINIEAASTNLEKIKAFWQLSEIQRELDNATLGEEDNPTNLTKNTFLRRWAEAGQTSTKPVVENFRAGDYIIISSKRGDAENPRYYYGIIQILQIYDDKDTWVDGRIDKDLAANLFMKPVYLNIKTQCEVL